ncbi:glycosyltransferase family 4 protein [Larkinella rosea]|uniref:Glycosyltransferase family 1 protein n=1 Tax=Larkinella rosea TaxID=2025312 RepID=A0A3P1BG88_9BACT|nr:glycosyltransferase family 1 protein [Larkinella rosea]RRA99822.1 glycosyltransferase family 1 protein [Larkinella rosea]
MKIFIDTERLRDLNSGLGQFCLQLGQELVRQRPDSAQLTFLVPEGKQGIFGPDVTYQTAVWWRKWVHTKSYDVWHCTHQDSGFLPGSIKNRLVLTIHDLNFLERPDYSDAKKASKRLALQRKIDRASAITTISEYTASVVRQNLTIPGIPLTVIHNGNSLNPKTAQSPPGGPVNRSITISGPYFLFVGVIHPKKNLHTLLPLLEAFPEWQLVLAGPDGHPYAAHLRNQAQQLGISDRLIITGAVDEATKTGLYQQCDAFLFPSISEGFGLPVVEAMSCGKPVFLSKLTSLPEIGGRDAYYFESFEPDVMAETIFDGLNDFAANPFRADRLRQQAARFSWEHAARHYWQLYTELG